MIKDIVWADPCLVKFSKVVGVGGIGVIFQPTRTLLEGGESQRISVNIFGQVSKLIFGGDANGFVCTLEKVADASVAGVEITNVFGAE